MPANRQTLRAFLIAVGSTALLASVFSTQVVIAGLIDIGVDIPVSTRVSMTFSDLPILAMFVPAVAACFLPGFALAHVLAERTRVPRTFWFVLAGASAFLVELKIIEAVLSLMPIGGARSLLGLALQGVAGALGGWLFAWLTAPGEDEA